MNIDRPDYQTRNALVLREQSRHAPANEDAVAIAARKPGRRVDANGPTTIPRALQRARARGFGVVGPVPARATFVGKMPEGRASTWSSTRHRTPSPTAVGV